MPDVELPDDWWTGTDVARYLGIQESSWRSYVCRKQAPPPDRRFNRSPVWRPETVKEWEKSR